MKSYGQFCPVAKAAQLFCQRWTPLLVRDLAGGPLRFSDLQRGVPTMSPSLLSRRLKELQAEGVIVQEGGRGSAYRLTESGAELVPMVLLLGEWGQRWTRRELAKDEVDLGLFIWAFERAVHPEAFGGEEVVVELHLKDQPASKQRWWFLNRPEGVELCLEPPGPEVGLWVEATLPDMIYVWRGDLALADALREGRIEVHGVRRLQRAFRRWFGVSVLAHVGPARTS